MVELNFDVTHITYIQQLIPHVSGNPKDVFGLGYMDRRLNKRSDLQERSTCFRIYRSINTAPIYLHQDYNYHQYGKSK